MFYAMIYVAIGNSDDKLPQRMWYQFFQHTFEALSAYGKVENDWVSQPVSKWQNAAFRVVFTNKKQMEICKNYMGELALRYQQESISWTPARDTEYLTPKRSHVRELPLPKALDKVIP